MSKIQSLSKLRGLNRIGKKIEKFQFPEEESLSLDNLFLINDSAWWMLRQLLGIIEMKDFLNNREFSQDLENANINILLTLLT